MVHHLWQYPYVLHSLELSFELRIYALSNRDLQTRKETREKAWQVDGWSDTVHKVIRFISSTQYNH